MTSLRGRKPLLGAALAALLVALGALVYAATEPDGTVYTVTFDAATGSFAFSDNVELRAVDGVTYPDLFRIDAAMPGDSFDWRIRVRVRNAGSDTVKLYVTAGDYNADYEALLASGSPVTPVLTAAFDPAMQAPTALGQLLDAVFPDTDAGKAARITAFEQHVGVDDYGVYLGAYRGADSARDIALHFAIPTEAGNEFADLNAWVHWVFTAEFIPASDGGGGGGGGGTPISGTVEDEDDVVLTIDEIIARVERDRSFRVHSTIDSNDISVLPGMLSTPWAFDTDEHFAYIIGIPGHEVKPVSEITRSEVATILFRCLREELRDYWWSSVNTFTDVPSNAWYNNAISTMANAGVLKGYPDGSFQPNRAITRAEFCAMIGRFFSLNETNTLDFSDIHGHWAEQLIRSVSAYEIVKGYEDGSFRPENDIARCEVVMIMNRVLRRAPKVGFLSPDMITWPDNMDTGVWYYAEMQEATNSHDFERRGDHEAWTQWKAPPDWKALETIWADRNTNRGIRTYRSSENGGGT